MKNLLYFLVVFLPGFFCQADTINFNEFNTSCFREYAEFTSMGTETLQAETIFKSSIFFVQNENFLPSRLFDYTGTKYLNYEILKITGLKTDSSDYAYLNDNNPLTVLEFDPYSDEIKEITIDLLEVKSAGSFSFNLETAGSYDRKYFVSLDNQAYTAVGDVENFDYRYLTIRFGLQPKASVVDDELKIAEINFLGLGNNIYLVNPQAGLVSVFAEYDCQDNEKWQKTMNSISDRSESAQFAIDSDTPYVRLDWKESDGYNTDFDGDGKQNRADNCPFAENSEQLDSDGDFLGDACDLDNQTKDYFQSDSDADGFSDQNDNCPYVYNPKQIDGNADKAGDLCSDDDNDGRIGYKDNCINIGNHNQEDVNVNGVGDACEYDRDRDGVFDSIDNCINAINSGQADKDRDDIGDACDNCKSYNPDQLDKNQNGLGDRCETIGNNQPSDDTDGDGVVNGKDNCPKMANFNQNDSDKDAVGDVCDNCADIQNREQDDKNNNGVGDFCEDADGDGLIGYVDNCVQYANKNQLDNDNDGVGDECEDDDSDNIAASKDNCPFDRNADQLDVDHDGTGDKCDSKDDRFIESNKSVFMSFIIGITAIFLGLTMVMLRKMSLKK